MRILWLITRRTVAERWPRLVGTVAAGALATGLLAGSLQFVLQFTAAMDDVDGSEYATVSLVARPGDAPVRGPESGSGARVSAAAVDRVAALPGVAAAAGDAAVPAEIVGADGRAVPAPAGGGSYLRPWVAAPQLSAYALVAGRAPAAAGEVVIDRQTARGGGLGPGDVTTLLLPDEAARVTVVGVVTVGGGDASAGGLTVLTDPGRVRQAAGLGDDWQALWVAATPGADRAVLAGALRGALAGDASRSDVWVGTGTQVRDAQRRTIAELATQITTNLGMLALVGAFVGVFVLAGTFGTLVRQRARDLALLLTVGMTPRQVRLLLRAEAVFVGLAAGLLGLVVGLGVARLLAGPLAGTGLDTGGAGPQLGLAYLLPPLAAGLLITWLASARPAWRASLTSPVESLAEASADSSGRSRRRLLGALPVLALAGMFVGLSFLARREDPTPEGVTSAGAAAILAGLLLLSALAVLGPYVVPPLGRLVGTLAVALRPDVGRMARAFIVRSPRRVASAASLLMLTVALSTVTWSLVTSITEGRADRGTAAVRADLVVSTDGGSGLPASVAEQAATVPGVRASAELVRARTTVTDPIPPPRVRGRPTVVPPLTVTGADGAALAGLVDLGAAGRPVSRLADGQIAVAAELAEAYDWPVGTRMTVRAAEGVRVLEVVATYSREAQVMVGDAIVTSATVRAIDPVAFVSVVLVAGAGPVADGLRAAVADVPTARVDPPRAYLTGAGGGLMFDPTLLYVFLGVAIVTALFGVATTLSLSVAERTREFGVLGAVGAAERQVQALVRWEAATVVVLGTGLGVATALGVIRLAQAVTGSDLIAARLPGYALPVIVLGAVTVTVLASVLPGRRAARVPVLLAVHRE
ncbi:FtsX-like permease family protein [Micromonospora sp. NPDC048170]|uniref:ABC transporter permease n=1 Tax=Micromonospora sp. NPDC048170 TaxID=3154819 RepID=UPI0033E504BF